MRNESQPAWGLGLVVEDSPQHWVLYFEDGGSRKFIKSLAKVLVPATLSSSELAALQAKASGRRPRASSTLKKSKRGLRLSAGKARFTSFKEQLALFENLFVGGFQGETFVNDERGLPGVTGKAGYKEAGIALAKEELSLQGFERPTEALFEGAKAVLQSTNLVFPIEGAIPFSGLDAGARVQALEGLKQLLHGEGDYAVRVQRFASSINIKDKTGRGRSPSWPLTTVFGALYNPTEFTCVKPTHFVSQAAMLGISAESALPVLADSYRRFHQVALKTQELLVDAGHQPRDLMDVYTFIWRTHAEKPK